MIIRDPSEITQAVQDEIARAPEPRFREIMTVAVRHLHDFVREAKLTEAEFQQACGCIAKLGQMTSQKYLKFSVLLRRLPTISYR
jgi:hydroxyquinol 1,2-dioxygenase